MSSTRGVNRAGPGPILKIAGRAERFYNLLEIRAGFLQSFTCTNFLTKTECSTCSQKKLKISFKNFLKTLLNLLKLS